MMFVFISTPKKLMILVFVEKSSFASLTCEKLNVNLFNSNFSKSKSENVRGVSMSERDRVGSFKIVSVSL